MNVRGARARAWFCALAGASVCVLAGCGDEKTTPPSAGPSEGIAVLVSDYVSSGISLVDPTTLAVAHDGCLTAATFSSTQVPLSRDMSLGSSPTPDHELVAIDRMNSVITFASPATCTVRAQLSVGTGGFKANPHDVLVLSAHKAYVTRYETNLAPDAAQNGLDGGDDILIIDPSQPAVTGRIPLASYATAGAKGATQARPGRLLRAGDRVFVSLDSQDATFSDQGPGRILAIDPATDQVTGMLDLSPLKNCGALDYDSTSKRLIVSCGGSFAAASQIDESGLAIFDLGTEPASMNVIPAKNIATQPLSFGSITLAGRDVAFVAALGSLDFATNAVLAQDAFLRVDLTAGTATALAMSSPYGFGGSLIVGAHVLLADGDATTPRVRVFGTEAAGVEGASLNADPAHQLPPRDLAFY
jgi:hypothetical protein